MKRLFLFNLCILSFIHYPYFTCLANKATDPIEGRYSFSLTTFHPSGSLPQLNSACTAASLGPSIVGCSLNDGGGILMISPSHEAVSPLIREDGTDRFVQVTKSIVMGHSGINADGRVLCTAAQRLAVEHEYTFDEEIPMNIFLEEMSLLMQRYTMKPGSRPFGCSLMIGFSQSSSATNKKKNQSGKIFTMDPSGAVQCWEDGIAFIGKDEGILQQKLKSVDVTSESVDEIMGLFMDDLTNVRNTAKYAPELGTKDAKGVHLLLAFFHQKSGLTVRKWSR